MSKQKKLFYSEFYKWTTPKGQIHIYGGHVDLDQGEYEHTGGESVKGLADQGPSGENTVWDGMTDWAEELGFDPDEHDEPELIESWAFEYLEEQDPAKGLGESDNGLDLDKQMLRVFESKLGQYQAKALVKEFFDEQPA